MVFITSLFQFQASINQNKFIFAERECTEESTVFPSII